MDINELWIFPVPSTCLNRGVTLYFPGGKAILKFDYFDVEKDDKIFNSGIIFDAAVAHRHSSEKFTKFISEAYDKLIEIKDSDWVKELTLLSSEWSNFWKIKHYAIYLDSYGLYEFIASGYSLMENREGALTED